jgi:hypothetical protein
MPLPVMRSTSLLVAAAATAFASVSPAGSAHAEAHWELVSRPLIRRVGSTAFDGVRKKVVAISGERGDASLWDWDGTEWTQWYPESPRPDAENAAIAFDPQSGRLVMMTAVADVWELDPTSGRWSRIEPAGAGPPPYRRVDQNLVYDGNRRRFYALDGDFSKGGLWEWDPATRTWTERQPPPVASIVAHAYDPDRARLVVLSKRSTGSQSYDVSEWDPATGMWTTFAPDPTFYLGAAAYDPVAKSVVAISTDGSPWHWDPAAGAFNVHLPRNTSFGGTWRAMTFDPDRQVFVLTGASSESIGSPLDRRDEVWEWNPDTYEQRQASPAHDNPGPTAYAATVWVAGQERVLMAGGTLLEPSSWFWRADAGRWAPAVLPTSPAPAGLGARWSLGLAYDPARQVAVAFGGTSADVPTYDELWETDFLSRAWTKRSAAGAAPPARRDAALAYDARTGAICLQGGSDGTTPLADGWDWDGSGSGWHQRTAAGAAPSGAGALLHEAERGVMLFVTSSLEVWERPANEGVWNTVDAPPPSAPKDAAVAFDTLRRRIVAYGGRDPNTQQERAELWERDFDSGPWLPVAVQGAAPAPRRGHTLVYEPGREAFFMHGGRSSALVSGSHWPDSFRDGWELTIRGLSTAERCSAAHADRCASGLCVDGYCCPSSAPCVARPDAAAPALDADVEPADAAPVVDAVIEPGSNSGADGSAPSRDAPPVSVSDAPAEDAGLGDAPALDEPDAAAVDLAAGVDAPAAAAGVDAADAPAAAADAPAVPSSEARLYASPGCSYAPSGSAAGGAASVLVWLLVAVQSRRRP